MANAAGAGDWTLKSGTWRAADAADADFRLVTTAQGHAVAEGLPPQDLRAMFCLERQAALLPPEFKHSPAQGQLLRRLPPGTPWVPPYGTPPIQTAQPAPPFLGLRRCEPALRLAGAQRGPQDDPDQRIPLPRPGRYEFFALRAATAAHLLLALDPDQGVPFVRLPCSGEWQALAGPEGVTLAASGLPRAAWRCAVAAGALGSRLLLPTEAGLARLTPDLPALRFELDYIAELPALGSPLAFDDRVWLPLRLDAAGGIRLLGVDARGERTTADLAGAAAPGTGRVHAPVSTAHAVVWPCERGQLRLRRPAQPRGAFRADFIPWPAGVRPEFDFGCPFLGHEGDLWQLGFDEGAGQYLYLRLGDEHGAREPVDAPRSCSGSVTWRSAGRERLLPWQQPEHVDDSRGGEAVLPLLEGADATVVALRLPAPNGLAEMFESRGKLPVRLVADDGRAGEQEFAVLSLSEPWRLRLLVHDGHLWVYHPELRELRGWRLAP